jgi:hypothetical protein
MTAPALLPYEFSDHLAMSNIQEVVQRTRAIFASPTGNQSQSRFSIASTSPGAKFPDLAVGQVVGSIRFAETMVDVLLSESNFAIHVSPEHETTSDARKAEAAGRAFTVVKILGGNGQQGLLNQSITVYGRNSYNVPFSVVVKEDTLRTADLAEQEARYLDVLSSYFDANIHNYENNAGLSAHLRDMAAMSRGWVSPTGSF